MHSQYPLSANKPLPQNELTHLWTDLTEEIREAVGKTNFELWFTGFHISHVEEGEVTLIAPGSIYALWVEENFKSSLLSIFEKYLDPCSKIVIDHTEDVDHESTEQIEPTEKKSKKEEILVEKISESKLLDRGQKAGLVPKFQFENFVVGDNSEIAWAASQAVARHPGTAYQPLFFHSACGLGKTHLLHAIGWETLRQRPSSKVIFVSAEHFGNDYIHAIQNHSLEAFRKKYREADLLMIDDIQFLGRKDGFQKEFFHTFNMLADRQKQIVLASDCPASEIGGLEERLSSRFQSGMSAEIYRPGLETRAAILRRKRDDWEMAVSDELIDAIVERVRGNVRVLEGALIRVAMVATMNEESIEPGNVGEILSDICGGAESANVGMEEIMRAVCEHYDIERKVLIGKKRTARVAEARQMAMFLCRTMTELSLMDIAAGFGKDHGTVIYAVKQIRKKCETSNSLKSTAELIKRRLVRGGSVKTKGPGPEDYRKRSQ